MKPSGKSPAKSEDFTLLGYRALLDALAERGYSACDYHTVDPASRHVILRHDIDMSLQSACRIAQIEQERGIRAVYFVLLRTEMYNPFSAEGERGLRRLVEMGHEIGLHFDASIYSQKPEDLEAACATECELLERFLRTPVRVISFHRPAAALMNLDRQLAGRRHAYEPSFVRGMGYCSDSRGGWFHGHPLEHPFVQQGRALQLLLHPIWWDAHEGDTAIEKLNRFSLARFDLLRSELARHCETYRDGMIALFSNQ